MTAPQEHTCESCELAAELAEERTLNAALQAENATLTDLLRSCHAVLCRVQVWTQMWRETYAFSPAIIERIREVLIKPEDIDPLLVVPK